MSTFTSFQTLYYTVRITNILGMKYVTPLNRDTSKRVPLQGHPLWTGFFCKLTKWFFYNTFVKVCNFGKLGTYWIYWKQEVQANLSVTVMFSCSLHAVAAVPGTSFNKMMPSLDVHQASNVPAPRCLAQHVLVTDCWMHNFSHLVEGLPLHCSWQETNLFVCPASGFKMQRGLCFSYDILKMIGLRPNFCCNKTIK